MRDLDLPLSWIEVPTGQLFSTQTGSTPSKKEKGYYGQHTPFVKPPELANCKVRDAEDGLSELGAVKARVLPSGSVMVSCIGNLGKVGINVIPVAFNQQINAILPFPDVALPEFVFFQVQSDVYRNKLSGISSATTISIVNKKKFDSIPLRLAPISEQRRIVEKIETLFARLDQGEAALRHTQTLLARYRQSVLKAAVTGALTADWRAENAHRLEHGRDLLARILQTRRETWQGRGKYQEPAAPDTTGLPELPEGWVWASFEQLFEAKSDGGKKLPQKQYLDSGLLPVIDQGEAEIGGYSNDETLAYDGMLPVIIFGDHTRRFKLVRDRFVCGADGVKIIEPSRILPVEYLYVLLTSAKFEDRGYSRHFQFVRRLVFPLAPEAEAREIVRRYEIAKSLIAELKSCCDAELTRSAALRQSILKDAFAGKLVPQNPADEPAAELLARIHASRDTAPKNSRRKNCV